ncbi:hypothetical protein GCM10009715_31650 [Paeniglutamicibacter psychrophenolicus]
MSAVSAAESPIPRKFACFQFIAVPSLPSSRLWRPGAKRLPGRYRDQESCTTSLWRDARGKPAPCKHIFKHLDKAIDKPVKG